MGEAWRELPSEAAGVREPDLVALESWLDDVLDKHALSGDYSRGPEALRARQGYYALATKPLDFDKAAADAINPENGSIILDAGCGAGRALAMLEAQYGVQLNLIGIDAKPEMFKALAEHYAQAGVSNVAFVGGNAERLFLPDGSIDGSLCLFMLYHTEDPPYVLSELARVTKPGGKIIVATSGPKNKYRHRRFESNIGDYLGQARLKSFAGSFDATNAELTLPLFFKVLRRRHQNCEVRIKDEADFQIYARSLGGMRHLFRMPISDDDWNRAIDTVVRPDVFREIEARGYFSDWAERHLYICENSGPDPSKQIWH